MTAVVIVSSCLALAWLVGVGRAASPAPGLEGAAPGTIFTLAGDPLIEGMATTIGQGISAIVVSGQTLYVADGEEDVIRAVDMRTDAESVVAGTSADGFADDGGPASAAELSDPNGLAVDPEGDLLVADSGNGRVRLIAVADCNSDCPYGLQEMVKGDIYTIAGLGPLLAFTEGPAVDSGVGHLRTLAVDAHGDLMISDGDTVLLVADYSCADDCPYGLQEMVKGDIYHLAGRSESDAEYAGDDESATSTGMNPEALTVDGEGNLLIADPYYTGGRVLLVAAADCTADCAYGLQSTTAGYVYTIAGGGTEAPAGNGLAIGASINPSQVQVDARGNVLLTEGFEEGHALMVAAETCMSGCAYGLAATVKNHIYVIAGGDGGLDEGLPAAQSTLVNPRGMATIADGGLLMVSDQSVWLLTDAACASECPFGLPAPAANDMYTVAGNGTVAFSGESGPPGELALGWPRAVTSNSAGDVLVLDARNGRVRMIAATNCSSDCAYGLPLTVQGDMYTIAGGGSSLEDSVPARSESLFGVLGDGQPNAGETPTSMTGDPGGDVLVLDGGNRVRLLAASNCAADCPYGLSSTVEGDIYTVAGNGSYGYSGDGEPARSAELGGGAQGMAVDAEGDLLIADTSNNRVRLLANVSCSSDCPYGLSAMTKGDIYTIVGTGEAGDRGDNKPAAEAELFEPADVTVDSKGDLLIADTFDLRVRFVAAHSCSSDCPYGRSSVTAGDIYPLAGDGALFYPEEVGTDGDGSSATTAPMQPPQAVAVDSAGNVLISESESSGGRSVVRMVAAATCTSDCSYGLPSTMAGDIYTIAGVNSTISGFSGDGGLATNAYLDGPTGLGFDSAGDLLIADTYNNRIRLITPVAKRQPPKAPTSEPPQTETRDSLQSEGNASGDPGAGSSPSTETTGEITPPVHAGVRITLPIRTLTVTSRGVLNIVLDLSQPTAGIVRLIRPVRSHGKHVLQLLATARFSANHAQTIRLRLTRTGRVLLKGTRQLSCILAVIPTADIETHPTFSLDIHANPSTHRHDSNSSTHRHGG